MRTKFSGILSLLLVFFVQLAFAQQKTVSGVITDENGLPLPGATVVVKGTSTGVSSDFDGNYSISLNEGQVLQFSFVGYEMQEVPVGASNSINVSLQPANVLEEVVVTALGIKREKQALGYAVSEVDSKQLEQRAEGDIGRVLTGKASGVNITAQSGLSGSATNIIIRGYSSFAGSNQPLFIVDGVPFSSDTNTVNDQGTNNGGASNTSFIDGNAGSSRFLDLDPNNIESVNILKGLSAATLYGSQGRNGVILITTKGGSASLGAGVSKKNEISVTTSFFFNQVADLPDYQDEYGGGFDQAFGWFFSNWGPAFRRDGVAGWGNDPAFDSNGTLPHPYSTASFSESFPELADARYEWRPYDSVENFFKTGGVSSISINARGVSDNGKISYNANYGYLNDEGFTPGNSLTRNNFSVGGRAELTNNFIISGTLNYARTDFKTPPVARSAGNGVNGQNSSIFGDLYFTPRSIDMLGLPFEDPLTRGSVYYRQNNDIQHPLWTVNNAGVEQLTNRVFGQISTQYNFNDNINLIYRLGLDFYNEAFTNYQNKGGVSPNGFVRVESGFYETWDNKNTIWDHNLVLNGNYDLGEDFGLTFNLGGTSRRTVFDQQGIASDDQQVYGVLRHFNFANYLPIQFSSEQNIVGLYAQADLDYRNWIYLTLNGRNDWVSNFSADNRSIFYPGVSTSFIPTQLWENWKSTNGLNFLKLR